MLFRSDDGDAGPFSKRARQIEGVAGFSDDGMDEDVDGDELAFGTSDEDEDDEDEEDDIEEFVICTLDPSKVSHLDNTSLFPC